MHILINEHSIQQQAPTPYAADRILIEFSDALDTLEPRRINDSDDPDENRDPIYSHSSIFSLRLCAQMTLKDLFYTERDHDSETLRKLRTVRTSLLRRIRNGPYIDTILEKILHECTRDEAGSKKRLDESTIAGAAYFEGILVSLQHSPHYPPGDIEVYFSKGEEPQPVEIEHYTSVDEIKVRRRHYWPHPKHDKSMPTYGVIGTQMDLPPEEAEKVLNAGIPIGKRVFGRSAKGKLYAFHRHHSNEYHGYPVDEEELRKRARVIYNYLRKLGWCD
ncbi:hypothetical protein [Candidatus Oscillochloris fontis]|uniref:hypothetical protein n=1 Tax=Candidatus Oscillochloris fontis TaxID=2496868 RepID=UPI00101BE8A9|nr:hypothetical protein [Candidatus Oscillochloris fontis]